MIRVGILLSGCGVKDGAEIHESVLAMLSFQEAGATVRCLALDKPQRRVVDHAKGTDVDEQRNMLTEAARIARGAITDVKQVTPDELDALVVVGGFGAALNLCDFALVGEKMTVDPDVEKLLIGMHEAKKPIGAICIAPVILAKVFGPLKAHVTVGTDPSLAARIEAMGAVHVPTAVDDCAVDEANRLVTTPAYMLTESLKEVAPGIRKLAAEVMRLAAR